MTGTSSWSFTEGFDLEVISPDATMENPYDHYGATEDVATCLEASRLLLGVSVLRNLPCEGAPLGRSAKALLLPWQPEAVTRNGRVVVLNGTSSAGKSTLASGLQDRWPGPLLDVGLDRHLAMLPRRYMGPAWGEVFGYEHDERGKIARVVPGPVSHRLVVGLHGAAAAHAHAGFDVVVDHVLLHAAWVHDLRRAMSGMDVTLVGVRCGEPVLSQREAARCNRTLGQAAAQLHLVHAHVAYDVEVDTAVLDPARAADRVMRALQLRESRGR